MKLLQKKLMIWLVMCFLFLQMMTTPVSAQMEWIGGAFCGVCILFWFVVAILIAVWVYKDAEKRGSNGALWLIIVILTGLIGLIIWLIARPPVGGAQKEVTSERRCPACGRVIPMDARVCPYCGKRFEE